jgi:hypothetical protein
MQCNVASPYDGEYHLAQYLNLGADWVSLLVQVSLRAHCSPVPKPALDTTLSPSPPQAMVRSTSPHSDPLSITLAASRDLAQNPRVLCTRADLIPDADSDPVANKSIPDSYTTTAAGLVGRSTLRPSPGYSHPVAHSTTTTSVRATVFIYSTTGMVIFVVVILALIYAIRVRQRKAKMIPSQDSTTVLRSGASPGP